MAYSTVKAISPYVLLYFMDKKNAFLVARGVVVW